MQMVELIITPAATGAEASGGTGYRIFRFICTYIQLLPIFSLMMFMVVLLVILSCHNCFHHTDRPVFTGARFNGNRWNWLAAIPANYTPGSSTGSSGSAWRDPADLSLVHIQFSGTSDGDSTHIVIQGVEDLGGNAVLSFTYTCLFSMGLLHDVVFS